MQHYQTDVAVIGAGLGGIVTALELLDCGHTVTLLDGSPDAIG
ncbi:MAG: FAD-binding protein [Marinobacter sp.]